MTDIAINVLIGLLFITGVNFMTLLLYGSFFDRDLYFVSCFFMTAMMLLTTIVLKGLQK